MNTVNKFDRNNSTTYPQMNTLVLLLCKHRSTSGMYVYVIDSMVQLFTSSPTFSKVPLDDVIAWWYLPTLPPDFIND